MPPGLFLNLASGQGYPGSQAQSKAVSLVTCFSVNSKVSPPLVPWPTKAAQTGGTESQDLGLPPMKRAQRHTTSPDITKEHLNSRHLEAMRPQFTPRLLSGSPGYSLPFSQGFSFLTHSDPCVSLMGEGGRDRI